MSLEDSGRVHVSRNFSAYLQRESPTLSHRFWLNPAGIPSTPRALKGAISKSACFISFVEKGFLIIWLCSSERLGNPLRARVRGLLGFSSWNNFLKNYCTMFSKAKRSFKDSILVLLFRIIVDAW